MPCFKKFLPVLFFGGIFVWTVFQIEPPKTLTEGKITPLALFFLPLFCFLTLFLNLFFQFFLRSLIFALGIIILLIFKALNFLNPVSFILVILLMIFIIRSFPKRKRLFYQAKIPRLSKLAKQR